MFPIAAAVLPSLPPAERLPMLSHVCTDSRGHPKLLTTRWFLCLWSSVICTSSLHRLWDFLFVNGPAATMQVALACMYLCEPRVLETRDIGEALAAVKDVLQDDGGGLLDAALHRVSDISIEQLAMWRARCRDIVVSEAHHLHSSRQLLKMQRASGFSLQELQLVARLCGPPDSDAAHMQAPHVRAIDYDGFTVVLHGLIPQWTNVAPRRDLLVSGAGKHRRAGVGLGERVGSDDDSCVCQVPKLGLTGEEPSLVERLFTIFLGLPTDDRAETDCFEHDDCFDKVNTLSAGGAQTSPLPDVLSTTARSRLTFEQLVLGLGWLLRGTSERRAELCFKCFADGSGGLSTDGECSSDGPEKVGGVGGGVQRAHFVSLLTSVYVMYEPTGSDYESARARVRDEAERFTSMMYGLWDPECSSVLDEAAFDRAAHHHPLLVQAFQLEQLELNATLRQDREACNPIGSARLRVKNGSPRLNAMPRLVSDHF